MNIIQRLALVAMGGAAVASCDVHGLSDPGTISSFAISSDATMPVTATHQFTVTGKDYDGVTVAVTPSWSVIAGGGTISSDGLFTAGTTAAGFANTIVATVGNRADTASVVVTHGPLAFIAVTPGPSTLAISAGQQFVATGTDAFGNAVPITPNWAVVASGGTVTGAGMFTAGTTAGTFTNTVQASSGLTVGTATVTVTAGPLSTLTVTPNPASLPVDATQQFTVVGKDASGNVVAVAPAWSVANGGGTISTTGLFTAGGTPGAFANTVKATVGTTSGTATVNVTAAALASITIAPNPASTAIQTTQQFTATGRDANGNIVAITPTWAVVNGGGSIDIASGLWTAGSTPGTYSNTVRANVGTIAGYQTVTVTTGPLATITVTPNPVTVQTSATQQFTAVGKDAGGNVLSISPTWSVVNATAGTINSSGLFTAGTTPGTYANTVKAQSGSVSGTATVTVSTLAPVLTTITVLPNPANLTTGQTQQFSATGLDQNGNPIALTATWSVVAGGGTINATTGLFTAGILTGTFTNTVQATSGAVNGNATVVITSGATPPPLVDLGTAALNGIMAGTAVTCVSNGTINANVSISPGNTITGFPPCVITGVQHLNDATAVQNQIDLTAAYNQLAGMPCPPANFISANLGGTTKAPGVYCSATSLGITGTLTLDGNGDPNANFVFQAGSSLTTAGNIVLINGAQAKNVYFQVGSSATIGTASQMQGNIITLTSITLVDNATLFGRALARNGGVSLGSNNVITLP
jgi:hypothetical protein